MAAFSNAFRPVRSASGWPPRLRVAVTLLALLGVVLPLRAAVAVDHGAATEIVAATGLKVSSSPDRRSPVMLESRPLSGEIYVFLGRRPGTHKVQYHVNDPALQRAPYNVATHEPFDLKGRHGSSAKPFDTRVLANGTHTITALLEHAGGRVRVLHSTIVVANDLGAPPSPPGDGLQELMFVNFQERAAGRYSEEAARSDWGPGLNGFTHKKGEARIVQEGSNRVLRVMQPKDTVGEAPTWGVRFGDSYDDHYDFVTFEYRLKFGDAFDFRKKGGKLPGVMGSGRHSTGQPSCTDRDGEESFNVRMMWRATKPNPSDKGQLESYPYHPDKTTSCGDQDRIDFYLEDDRWYNISMDVVMNTPGRRDGEHVVRVDGREVYRRSNFMWRVLVDGEPAFGIDKLLIQSYFGGKPDTGFEHDRDEYIFYDDFRVLVRDPTY